MNKIRHSRYQGLVEIIEYYSAQDDDGKSLSKEQCEQLKNACDTIECFGELGQQWAEIGREILSRNEHASINESQLRNIIKESIQEHLVDVMKRYTEGRATSKEANKAIMDLANSGNGK